VKVEEARASATLATRIESRARPGAPFQIYLSQDPVSREFWLQTSPLTPPGDYFLDTLVETGAGATYRT
jgi:hypothetical protein